ncbi:hypothetical protein MR988_08060 [bacterium]|nr:hypothetical protein [bacterium]
MSNCKSQVKTAAAFGLGLLTATILPCECVVVISAVTIVIICIKCSRR